ncbi:unnamed protein product [Rhodiola kirilowii]
MVAVRLNLSLPIFLPPSVPITRRCLTTTPMARMMTTTSSSGGIQSRSSGVVVCRRVPEMKADEMERIREETFRRYMVEETKRSGKGVAIVWFRNDLRILDNEALFSAWRSSAALLPVYCVDPRLFGSTHLFGFAKTGALRARFLIESLADLKENLRKHGLNLLIRNGKPEDVLPSLVEAFGAHTVYAHEETCSEELKVERLVARRFQKKNTTSQAAQLPNQKQTSKSVLQLIWGSTMYHIDDLPFDMSNLPDVYTQFRKSVESKCSIRSCLKMPKALGPPPPNVDDWGSVPSMAQLGHHETEAGYQVSRGMRFVGGETAALARINDYFWKKDLLRIYKVTRNGMLGPDYSTKFSPWLASGSLSPRLIHEEVKLYERQRESNESTYWVLFELIWRDYFRFLSIKCANSLFQIGGPRKVEQRWSQDTVLFDYWKDGRTGYPLIDANMKELSTTGFMSNRGRQIVCSFLVRDMGIDWRMGAEWFETCLLDYDPCSNYGNWTYGAGVGNDPREDRYFSIPKQAKTYDPDGEYVSYWLPELQQLPKEKRNFPGNSYIKPVVALKFSNTNTTTTTRRNNFTAGRGKPTRGQYR